MDSGAVLAAPGVIYKLEQSTDLVIRLGSMCTRKDASNHHSILENVTLTSWKGYASLSQIGTGLRQRIYSRAFIVGSTTNHTDRWVYLVLDTANGDTAVRNGILEGVAALGSGYSAYGSSNIAVTGTHSHSGPGACKFHLLNQ